MKQPLLSSLLLAVLMWASFSACKREQPTDQEVQTSIDNSLMSSEFSSIQNLIDTEARGDTSVMGNKVLSGSFCFGSSVSVNLISSTQIVMVVDFGSGATCLDGKLRTGKLIGTFNGKWGQAGTTVTIVPDDYTVNGFAMDFEKTVTYNGRNNLGNHNWDVEVTNATLFTTQGNITWQCSRSTEWTAGESTAFNYSDNEYRITGTASGRARTNRGFTVTIDSPLEVKLNCSNVVAGILSLTPDGLVTRTLDYGPGTCDNQAVLTVGGFTSTITLP